MASLQKFSRGPSLGRLAWFILALLSATLVLVRQVRTVWKLQLSMKHTADTGWEHSGSRQLDYPDTSLESNESICDRGMANWTSYPTWHPFTQLVSFLPTKYDESMLRNAGFSQKPPFSAAICKFRKIGRDWFALPDFMQQLTRCMAFWHRLVPSTAGQAVFYVGPPIPPDRPHITQMFQVLREALNVTVVLNDTTWLESVQQRPDYIVARALFHVLPLVEHPFQGYAFAEPPQVAAIRQRVLSHFGIPLVRNADGPVVAILDSPRLGSVHYLREGLLQNLPSHQRTRVKTLQVSRFSSMAEIIRSLSQVDILVAPHGFDTHDVLSQILWMPPCGGFVEVFPPYHFAPHVHGSLAAVMGDFSYASIYTGINVTAEWYEGALNNFSLIRQAQKAVSCPDISVLAETVDNMTHQWHACRQMRATWQRPTSLAVAEKPFPLSTTDGCLSMANSQLEMSQYPSEMQLQDLIRIIAEPPSPTNAVCVFVEFENWDHFPHAMQQLYRCFSFWQLHPHLKPYLLFKTFLPETHDFVWSVRRKILGQMFGVEEIHNHSDVPGNSLVIKPHVLQALDDHPQQGIRFGNLQHADIWRRTVQDYLNISSAGCKVGKTSPVIAILDRRPRNQRKIINLDFLLRDLSTLVDGPVQVHYFEKESFQKQVEIMSSVDILISGHGAQLTSIHYMPLCGGVLEFFSPGYYIPGFFGNLASSSGLHHGVIYTGANRTAEWDETSRQSVQLRNAARSLDICVPLDVTIASVKELIGKWEECCKRQT